MAYLGGDPGRGGGAPPGMTPWPGPPPQPGQPAVVYTALHQGAYQPGVAQVVYWAPSPGAPSLGGIRAPPAPYQPAQVAAPQAAAPFAAALAKEVEQKLFVTENALGPPAAAAAVSKKGPAHPGRPGYGAAGKKVMIHENNFLHNVVDNNLFHNDEMINGGTEEPRFCGGLIQMCNVENALRDVQRRTTELPVRYAQGRTVLDSQIGLLGEIDSNINATGLQHTHDLMKKMKFAASATPHPRRVLAVALALMVAFAVGPMVALAKCEQQAHAVASLCGGTGIYARCCFALKRSLDGGDPLCLCSLANNREVAEMGLNSTRILSLYRKCEGNVFPVLPAGGCEEVPALSPSPPPLHGSVMPPPLPPATVEPVISAPMVEPPPPPAMITPLPPSTPVFTLPPPPPVTTAPSTALPAGASAAAPSTGVLRRIYQALIGLLCLVAGFLLVAVFVVVRKYWKPQLNNDVEMGSSNAADQSAIENAKKAAAEAQSSAEAAASAAAGSLATAQAASGAAQAAQAATEEVVTVQANAAEQAVLFVEALGRAAQQISTCTITLGQLLQLVSQIIQAVRAAQGGAASAAAAITGLFARFGEIFGRVGAATAFVEAQAVAAQGAPSDLIDIDCINRPGG
nr:expressed protein [Oryza sativa Japonica Group]